MAAPAKPARQPASQRLATRRPASISRGGQRPTAGPGPAPLPPRRSPSQQRAQKHPLGHDRLHGGHPCTGAGGPAAPVLEWARPGQFPGALLAHGLPGRDDRLPPPALPPRLPGAQVAGARLRHLRSTELPARPPRLGGPAPPPPQVFRHPDGSPHQPQGLLVEPHGLDAGGHPRHGGGAPPHRRPGQRPLLPLAKQLLPAVAVAAGCPAVLDRQCHRRRWLGPGALGNPPAPGGGLPLHLAGELGHPPLGRSGPRQW